MLDDFSVAEATPAVLRLSAALACLFLGWATEGESALVAPARFGIVLCKRRKPRRRAHTELDGDSPSGKLGQFELELIR